MEPDDAEQPVLLLAYHRPLFGESPDDTIQTLSRLEDLTDEVYVDDASRHEPRLHLRAMLDRVRSETCPVVVVAVGLERLGRSFSHCVSILDGLRSDGAGIHLIDPDHPLSLVPAALPGHTSAGETSDGWAVVAALNEARRRLASERARLGAENARELGRVLGRKPTLTDEDREEIWRRIQNGEHLKALAEFFGVSVSTVRRARDTYLRQHGITPLPSRSPDA